MLDYIRFSLRILQKNKTYSVISVLGLAVGITCCILISLFVHNEMSYDHFHKDKHLLYRLTTIGGGFTAGLTSLGIAPTLKKDHPEVVEFCRYMNFGNLVDVKHDDRQFNEQNILFVDSTFFQLFGFRLLEGDPATCLTEPKTVVLSQKMAEKYFGDVSPINQTIDINKKPFRITGIVENHPGNSDIQYQALVSMTSLQPATAEAFYQDWFRVVCFTYIKFSSPPNLADFQQKLDDFSLKYVKPWGEANDTEQIDYYRAQNIEEVHFDNTKEFDSPKGNINYIYIFSSVAIFVLLIACINYINLSLSQSTSRAKEIGVRKTLGSDNSDIKTQFLTETFLITLFAFFIALILVELFMPTFNQLTLKSFSFGTLVNPSGALYSVLFVIIITLLSGLYPAFVLSSFNPIEVLKGQKGKRSSIGITRKVLITLQFAFSISMIMSSMIVFQQMYFMKNKDLGFSASQTLVFRIPSQDSVFSSKLNYIRDEFAHYPGVEATAFSGTVPGTGFGELMFRVEQDEVLKDAQLKLMGCDEQFLHLIDVEWMAGEPFKKELIKSEKKSFIINQKAADTFGWGNDAIGKRMQWGLLPNGQAENDGVVVGVVKDFHIQSLHNEIAPLAVQLSETKNFLSIKLSPSATMETIEGLKNFWQEELGDRIMDSFFLDINFNQQYQSEERMLSVFNYFTILSIILSALGLFALTSFLIKQKTKEIGIRKVLGASLKNIILILSKDFIVLMFIGLLLAGGPTYYFINQWLHEFSYHITIGIFPVCTAVGITFLVLMSVIVYNTVRSANFNPIDALRSE